LFILNLFLYHCVPYLFLCNVHCFGVYFDFYDLTTVVGPSLSCLQYPLGFDLLFFSNLDLALFFFFVRGLCIGFSNERKY